MIKLLILMAFGKKVKQTRLISFMIKSYLLFYMLVIPITNFAQSFQWIKPYPAEYVYNTDLLNYFVSVDNNDHVFLGGMFMFHENYASAAFGDLNIRKMDANGNELYSFYAYGSGNIVNMIHDSEDNLILIIDLREDLLFDTSDTLFHSGVNVSSHLVKLSPEFDLLWTKMIDDDFSYSIQKGIAIDSDNMIYFAQDDFQNSQITILNPLGEEVDTISQENVSLISSIAIDDEGNIYTAGACAGIQATFGGVLFEHELSYNFYIAKYNNQHNPQWVKYVEDVTCQFPEVRVSDPDHVYFIGELYFSTMFGSIPTNGPNWVFDFFVAKLNADGEFEWVAEVPESTVISGDASIGKLNSSLIDSDNNLCISGFIRGNIDWGNDIVTTSTNISYDLLLLKYNPEGEVIMAKYGGGESFDKAISCNIDSNDNLYIAGYGYDSTTFDNLEAYHEGYYPFLLKLNNENTSTGLQINEQLNPLSVYPNPVSDFVNIELVKTSGEIRFIHLRDLNGSVLENIESTGKSILEIDLSQYQSGVYFIDIYTLNKDHYTQKIIKL